MVKDKRFNDPLSLLTVTVIDFFYFVVKYLKSKAEFVIIAILLYRAHYGV